MTELLEGHVYTAIRVGDRLLIRDPLATNLQPVQDIYLGGPSATRVIDHLLECRCPSRPACQPHADDRNHQWRWMCQLPHGHRAPDPSTLVKRPAADVLQVALEVASEYGDARAQHSPMASAHEGYAVILEEVEETEDVIGARLPLRFPLRRLWRHVKADTARTQPARREAIQVAAMAVAFILEVCDPPRHPEPPNSVGLARMAAAGLKGAKAGQAVRDMFALHQLCIHGLEGPHSTDGMVPSGDGHCSGPGSFWGANVWAAMATRDPGRTSPDGDPEGTGE